MKKLPSIPVLLTFDFEEWEANATRMYEADLYDKTKRVVDFLNAQKVPVTFFLDASTVLKYPEAAKLLVNDRFELALHCDKHFHTDAESLRTLDFSTQNSETQVRRIKNAISMIRQVLPDFEPKGFRSPGLRWNEALYDSLNKLRFLYDSSQQSKYAFQPFLKNDVIVFPVNSEDYDSACYKMGAKYMINLWTDHFEKAREVAEKKREAYFMLLLHPSVSGKFRFIGMFKAIVKHLSNTKFKTCFELATEYREKLTRPREEAVNF